MQLHFVQQHDFWHFLSVAGTPHLTPDSPLLTIRVTSAVAPNTFDMLVKHTNDSDLEFALTVTLALCRTASV